MSEVIILFLLNLLPNISAWFNLGVISEEIVTSCSLFLTLPSLPHYISLASSKLQKVNVLAVIYRTELLFFEL